MKQIFEIEESAAIQEDITRSWYRKSHNYYELTEEITRERILCQQYVNKIIAGQAIQRLR